MGRRPPTEKLLRGLQIEVNDIAGRARDTLELIIISEKKNPPLARYVIKTAHHISEPSTVKLASKHEVGPMVFDVEGKGRKAIILEEGLPDECNIDSRALRKNEIEPYGKYLANFFLAFVSPKDNSLLWHGDLRPEHIFMIGKGSNIGIRLIDWGRGGPWPLKRIGDWTEEQLDSFYHQLSFQNPVIWKLFINSLNKRVRSESSFKKLGLDRHLTEAYLKLIRSEISPLIDHYHRMNKFLAVKFLELMVKARPLNLDLGVWNDFFAANTKLKGDALAEACEDFCAKKGIK